MHRSSLALILAAASLSAQQSPARPSPVPVPAPAPTRPVPDPAPWSFAEPAVAAAAAERAYAMRIAQDARTESLWLAQDQLVAARAGLAGQTFDLDVRPVIGDLGIGQGFASTFSPGAPRGWAPQDPADSLYRQAQQAINRGDYRRAAALFKDLPVKQPNSVYASDALYWEAFALYRIGGTAELQEALTVLDERKTKYPVGRTRGDADPALAVRIAGVLSARGLGDKDLVKRALTEGGGACDSEDQAVRAEALNALRQADPDEALAQARKILGRKDDCSVQLRRSALWMLASKKDAAATATLVSVAKGDPSSELRSEAAAFLGSMSGDEALAALEDLTKSDDERVQRAAIRALTTHPSPRARAAMHALIENNGANEQLRIAALDAFGGDRSTLDDAAWLRSIYSKVESARVRAHIVTAVARIGGDQNEQWLLSLAKNEDESVDVRQNALRFVARTADMGSLNKFYDGVSARPLREEIINALGSRKEPEATDKLIEIAKSGTDPQVRRYAINTLSRKNDPRTKKLLLDLIDGNAAGKP